jgi:glycosyltransferase involved in cell wall biosynthesis
MLELVRLLGERLKAHASRISWKAIRRALLKIGIPMAVLSGVRTALVFGVLLDNGETDWPGRNQLMIALSAHVPVILLERVPGPRGLLDLRRPRLEMLAPNLYVLRSALAVRSSRMGRRIVRLAAVLDGRWLRAELRAHGFDDFRLWLTVADPVLARGTPGSKLIYDCMDPNFLPDVQAAFDRKELALGRRASLVFASAATLFDRMKAVNPKTYLLPNAAPRPEQIAARGDLPNELRERAGPLVGYLGTVDWRFAPDPVAAAARALPAVTFAIVGRVNADQTSRVEVLTRLPNVVFCGPVSAAVGNACIAAFSVGIIPFEPSPTSDAINPVKMWMYLAAGLPVITTRLAECRNVPGVTVAEDDEQFVTAITTALAAPSAAAAERAAYASQQTWDDRAQAAFEIMRANGVL